MKSKVIGLTGQTGAGKSTVSHMIGEMVSGTKIIDADKVAREALTNGSDCLKRLAKLFGCDIIRDDGSCDRKLLAQRAFSSEKNTSMLNEVTHPWIIARIEELIIRYRSEQCSMIVLDAPLLYESGGDALCDCVAAVTAPENVRLKRIIDRDGLTEQEALLRIKAQHQEQYYRSKVDFVIDGSLPPDEVRRQTELLLQRIKRGI